MCGIAGFVNLDPGRPAQERLARAMTGSIRHRGPDDEGFHVRDHVALGMRRLSIIDLATGQQPIANEDGTVWVVFNGEVYNYVELREELQAKGHTFRTRSDTEVLVHLYEEVGEDFVSHINAMAAVAIWDAAARRLVLARDRMGKKPLHYALTSEALVFGSEIKALLEHPAVSRAIDPASVARYLIHEYVPCPDTMFAGIRKLRPGHVGVFENGRFRESAYWDVPIEGLGTADDGDLEERMRETLHDAVKRRLLADVPLGVFLSGGIDSTSIVACMSRAAPGQVRSFSIAFEDSSFDESKHFRRVAQHYGTRHEDTVLTPAETMEIIPLLADHMDEPLGDASILPTYLLSRFTRRHVKVALGGEGGDELLAGYPTYVAHKIAALYESIPRPLRSALIEPVIRGLPVSRSNISFDFKAKKFIAGAGLPPEIRNQVWLGSFSGGEALSLLSEEVRRALAEVDLFEEARRHMRNAPARDTLGKLLYVDQKMYLQDGILVKVDRASMACSLEVRAPLLDYRFVELVSLLPTSRKLRGFRTKHIFKKAMEPWLPRGIVNRPKKGFGVPVAEWLRGPLRTMMMGLLEESRIRRQGILDPAAIRNLITEHLDGTRDNRKQLWTVLMLQLWFDRWAGGGSVESLAS